MACGGQYVMMDGLKLMPILYVGNLDIPMQVLSLLSTKCITLCEIVVSVVSSLNRCNCIQLCILWTRDYPHTHDLCWLLWNRIKTSRL